MRPSLKLIVVCASVAASLALLLVVGPFTWNASGAGDVPDHITYQGTLFDANGQPVSGTTTLQFLIYGAAEGGSPLWSEPAAEVSVVDGFFTVVLGTVTPLDHNIFDGPDRYVEVRVNGTPLPRQRLTAVPFAHRAYAAASALSSQTAMTATHAAEAVHSQTALSATYATTATHAITAAYALDGAASDPPARVVIVAQSGGDFTSIKEALDSIADASAANPVLVWVAPGVYMESGLLHVQSYVHVRGAGPRFTTIRSTQGGSSIASTSAALAIESHSRVSDLTLLNGNNASVIAIGIWAGTTVTRSAVLDNVEVTVNGAGGTGHYALYLYDAGPTVRDSTLHAYGATGGDAINAALASANPIPARFPQPLIEQSKLIGGNDDGMRCEDATATGYGIYAAESIQVVGSYICGGHRGILLGGGVLSVRASELWVSPAATSYLFETKNASSIQVATSLVVYYDNRHIGTGSLTCTHSFASDYTAVQDGVGASACN